MEKEREDKAERAAEKEALEKAEAKRQAELQPDKDKLIAWANSFNTKDTPSPKLKAKEAKKILKEAIDDLEILLQKVIEKAENL